MNRCLDDATAHLSAAAPYSRPGLRRRLSALRAGLKAALRALRASNIKR
ncbi:hypothetical protein [Aromatoleum anaerobium]|uniref:Uncharacterized protein n=1 Tax=Aromatoleum anaerobium TaxID=182180 RepID=A0ABX1PN92_9RHOO|nr:hypothetical protein [Aromatoleum anaerobium]MCK0507284.1 hypothetical protein [Aromatoleum anaerobium]